MKKLLLIVIICLFTIQCERGWLIEIINPTILGCKDSTACNYNSDADEGDGSCIYTQTNYDCSGDCVVELDCNGQCNGTAVEDFVGGCCEAWFIDCAGDCNGDAVEDDCGECVEGLTGLIFNFMMDCNGICDGSGYYCEEEFNIIGDNCDWAIGNLLDQCQGERCEDACGSLACIKESSECKDVLNGIGIDYKCECDCGCP